MQRVELSLETKKQLARLILYIGEAEQIVEFCRQNLTRLTTFEPYAAFQRLDRQDKGFVTPQDISLFMR